MKTNVRMGIFLVLAASTLLTPACKKKSDDPKTEDTPLETTDFSAKIDGTVNYSLVFKTIS